MHSSELQIIANQFHQSAFSMEGGAAIQIREIKDIMKKAASKGEYMIEIMKEPLPEVIRELRRDGYKVRKFSKVTVREGGAWNSEKAYRISWKPGILAGLLSRLFPSLF
jgi:hypothetical protein